MGNTRVGFDWTFQGDGGRDRNATRPTTTAPPRCPDAHYPVFDVRRLRPRGLVRQQGRGRGVCGGRCPGARRLSRAGERPRVQRGARASVWRAEDVRCERRRRRARGWGCVRVVQLVGREADAGRWRRDFARPEHDRWVNSTKCCVVMRSHSKQIKTRCTLGWPWKQLHNQSLVDKPIVRTRAGNANPFSHSHRIR